MASKSKPEVDSMLDRLGNIGSYQWKVYILSCLPVFIAGSVTASVVFTTSTPNFRCFVEGCDLSTTNNTSLDQYNMSHVQFTIATREKDGLPETCSANQKIKNTTGCTAELFDNQTQSACDKYVFERKYFKATVVTEFGLICDSSWWVAMIQSSFFCGILIGAMIFGYVSDKYGRKTVFIFICPTYVATLFVSAYSWALWVFILCMVIKGMFVAGIYQAAFVIGIEYTGGRWRFWLGNIHNIVFAMGSFYTSIAAYFVRAWRMVELSQNVPVGLMLVYPCVIPESIRWLMANGKTDTAVVQIRKAAQANKITIPEEAFTALYSAQNVEDKAKQGTKEPDITDLFRHPALRIWTISLLFIWFANALVYYGLAFFSSSFHENIYLSMSLLAIVEAPGVILTTAAAEKFSRKNALASVMIFGGICCMVSTLSPPSLGQLKLWSAVIGRGNISGSFAMIFVYTCEIFPTVLRITGLGACNVFARIGGMSAPYVLQLTFLGASFPFMVVGFVGIFAGLSACVLPETAGRQLPDTVEDVYLLQDDKSGYKTSPTRSSPNSTAGKSIVESTASSKSSADERANLLGN